MVSEESRESLKKRIDQLFDKLNDLEKQFKNASETRKLELKKEMDELRSMRDDLQVKYDDFRKSSSLSAREMRIAFEQSAKIFRERMDNVMRNFKGQTRDKQSRHQE